MRAAELVREHRGDSHIPAWVARRRRGEEMNVRTDLWLGMAPGSYSADARLPLGSRRRCGSEPGGARAGPDGDLTAEGRQLRDDIEAATDAARVGLVDAIGGALEGIVAATRSWSQRISDAGLSRPTPSSAPPAERVRPASR